MKTVFVKETRTKKAGNGFLILAVAFFVSGFSAPVAGMIFAVVHSMVAGDVLFNRVSTILFVVSMPMLFVGSHLMDVYRNRRLIKRREIQRKIKD